MIKNLLFTAAVVGAFSSCNVLKPVASQGTVASSHHSSSPQFINNINVTPSSEETTAKTTVYKPVSVSFSPAASTTESLSSLQFKYGIMLNVAVEQLTNLKLLETIDEWYGSRYKYGGSTKDGIDCSAFAGTLMTTVFGFTLPRTAREQYASSQRIEKDELQEGDLVFFNTSRGVSHVGVYLENNKFVHASTSAGVMISDLNDDYYLRKYVGAGRIL